MKKLKDKKVIIYKLTETRNKYGDMDEALTPIHSGKKWAYFRHTSAAERNIGAADHNIEDAIFAVNYDKLIEPQMYILFGDDWFYIERLDRYEGYKSDLTLYTTQRLDPPKYIIKPYQ